MHLMAFFKSIFRSRCDPNSNPETNISLDQKHSCFCLTCLWIRMETLMYVQLHVLHTLGDNIGMSH
jgi:hypothetical protein